MFIHFYLLLCALKAIRKLLTFESGLISKTSTWGENSTIRKVMAVYINTILLVVDRN